MGLSATIYLDSDTDEEIANMRIGNIGMVGHLSDLIGEQLPLQSVLMDKVLYSGSHCGDELTLSEVKLALDEIHHLQESPQKDSDLVFFLEKFGNLCATALEAERGITF